MSSSEEPTRQKQSNEKTEMEHTAIAATPAMVLGGAQLKKRVGQGGMGEVWLATDIKLQRQVAIKLMRQDMVKTDDATARFYQEARAVAKVNHPNIIQIFQIGEERGLLFFSMEWVEGQSLSEYLSRRGPMSRRSTLEVAIQVIDGLAFACANNVIHRDIKPANIMLTSRGQVKLADFGLAKITNSDTSLTSSGVSMGSPNYMSPEMAKGEAVDHRADIYSVGITLYQMLTGNVPFSGPSATAVILKHIQEPLPVSEAFTNLAGADFVRIIRKMTAKNASERYQKYEDLRTDLHAVLTAMGPAPDDRPMASVDEAMKQYGFGVPISSTHNPSLSAATSAETVASTPAVPLPPSSSQATPLPAKKSMGPLVAIGASLVVVFISLAIVISSGRSKDSVGTTGGTSPGTSAVPGLRGEVFLKLAQGGSDPMAGQKIFLFDDLAAEQLAVTRSALEAQNKAINDLTARLRPLLEEIRNASSADAKLARLRTERDQAVKDNEASIASGQVAKGEAERLAAALETLRKQATDFEKLGYENFPVQDPITGETVNLTALSGKKEASKQRLADIIAAADRRRAARASEFESLKQRYADGKASIAKMDEAISYLRNSMAPEALAAKRAQFTKDFRALLEMRGRQLDELRTIAETNVTPRAETVIGRDGTFEFPTAKPGNYTIKLYFDLKWQEAQDNYIVAWLQDVPPEMITAGAPVRLTQDNMLLFLRSGQIREFEREIPDVELEKSLNFYLSTEKPEEINPAFAKYAEAILGTTN